VARDLKKEEEEKEISFFLLNSNEKREGES
jgi:hypothetical protein